MELNHSHDRLELVERERSTRAGVWKYWPFAMAAVATVLLVLARAWAYLPVLIIGSLVALLLAGRAESLVSTFDRAQQAVTISRMRRGRCKSSSAIPLADIDTIIVEAQSPITRDQRGRRYMPIFAQAALRLRPALFVHDRIVPLTVAFERSDKPIGIVRQMRAFTGLPQSDLLEDSVAAMMGQQETAAAGRHLARHVFDLDFREADELLNPMIDGTRNTRRSPGTGEEGGGPRRRLGYRREGWIGAALYVLAFAAFILGGKLLTGWLGG